MRSAELARLAATTVRALRHYHQIGLLDEPVRSDGGYRDYGLEHLVRVLGIRRLVGLGLSLEAVAEALDGEPERRGVLLDALDAELGESIARLQRQRAVVAAVRSVAGDPALSPGSARYLARLEREGVDAGYLEDERALLLLLAHGLGEAADQLVAAVEETLLDPGRLARTMDLAARFRAAEPADEDAVVEAFLETAVLLRGAASVPHDAARSPQAEALFAQFWGERLTPVQARILRRVEAGLDDEPPDGERSAAPAPRSSRGQSS